MKKLTTILICLAAIFTAGCRYEPWPSEGNTNVPTPAAESDPQKIKNVLDENDPRRVVGRVTHISDGDTFIIEQKTGEKLTVRIHAIDAPELSQAHGRESRESLRALIANQEVEVRKNKTDQYRRVVGDVFCDGKDIGLEQVKNGFAWHYKQFQKEQSATDRKLFVEGETNAQSSRLGLWAEAGPTNPEIYRRKNGTRK